MICSSNWMVFPLSMVIAAVLKGNMFGFGDPVAKEMTDFGALLCISAAINTEEKKKKRSRKTSLFQYVALHPITLSS